MLIIKYEHCGIGWFDTYECAVDAECPVCGQDVSPLDWNDAREVWNAYEASLPSAAS